MRGRLTDTNENRVTVDYIRSRFERAGLKPASGTSYFHTYNLMTATLGEGNTLTVSPVTGGVGSSRELKGGQEFYPQRFSASGRASGQVIFAGFGITAPKWNHDDYKGRLDGRIVLVLDHEPGERDPKSPFEGVVTAEPAAAWRKALAAQEKGAAGILFVSDVHNHPDPANFEQAARNFWPATPSRIPNYTLATWADRIRIPAAQISPALAESAARRNRQDAGRARQAGRGGRRHDAGCDQWIADRAACRRRSPHRAGSQRPRPGRRQRSEIEGRVGARHRAFRSRWRQRRADPQRRRRQRLGHGGADGDCRCLRAGGAAGSAAAAQRVVRRVEFRGARAARRVGLYRAPAGAAREHRRRAQHGHDRQERGSGGRRRQPLQRLRGADRGVERQRGEHDGLRARAGTGRGGGCRQRGHRPRDQEALRQQPLESRAPQRSMAVPAARRAGTRLHDRPAPGLPHASTTVPRRSTT